MLFCVEYDCHTTQHYRLQSDSLADQFKTQIEKEKCKNFERHFICVQ